MSPPGTTAYPTDEIGKSDCPFTQNLKPSDSFNFSTGSTDAAGFNYSKSGNQKTSYSSRYRPRLVKVRKKQVAASQDGKSVNTDLGLNGFSDVNEETKFEGKFGSSNRSSGINGSSNDGDSNQNVEQNGNRMGSGVGLGVGNVKSFNSSMNSSKSNPHSKEGDLLFGSNKVVQKESGSFVFSSDKAGFTTDQDLPEGGINKPGFHLNVDEFGKVKCAHFSFGASKNAPQVIHSDPQKQDCSTNIDKSESDKDAGNTVPDMRGKVKLDSSGDSVKVCHPSFEFPFNSSGSSCQNHVNFVFGSNNSDSKPGIDLGSNSTDSGKENAEMQFQNAHLNGVFVFGGLKGKGGLDCGRSNRLVNEPNQSNTVQTEELNGFGQHNPNIGSDINSKSSSGSSLVDQILSDEMKRLSIDESEVDSGKTKKSTSNYSANANSFDQRNSGFMTESHPINGFCKTPSKNNNEKDCISFTSKLPGLDADSTNMKFAFSNPFPGLDMLDKANSKSLRGNRLKKKHVKLRQRTVVQQLFGQEDCVPNDDTIHQNQSPAGCGSPMDFSPCHGTSSNNAPNEDIGAQVKVEFAAKEKDILEHSEKSHDDGRNSNFSPLPGEDGLSAVRRQYKKKYKLKVRSNQKVQGNNSDKENVKQEPIGTATHEVCEHWRIRGNKAYHAGELSKAEEFYSMGINSVPLVGTMGLSMKPLLLCYSNRAATRMTLGRMREAIKDCIIAAEVDPNFLKATLRAANCYLVLGEVEDATQCYNKCLSPGTGLCLDRRVTIEAADGLQKTKRVAEYMHESAKLLEEGTENAASSALGNITDALSISRYSDKLLEMKGEALYILRMYDEAIHLCEQTLDTAIKNLADHVDDRSSKSSNVKLWRWHLQTKSHYRLGKLELALDLIEKQQMPISSKSGDVILESSIALAATIRELLSLKKSGNEAFNAGRYAEAIESYSAAISKSFESRPFMAICFCNRAAAYQATSHIVDAIADCSLAIALNENYQKAISRRATLYEMIRDYKQAMNDLERLTSLLQNRSQNKNQHDSGRSSGGSAKDLRKTRRHLSLIEEKAKGETPLDVYLILGIKVSDAESEVKKAYRKAALRHHPDKAGQVLGRSDVGGGGTLWKEIGEKIHNDADRLFKIIGEAYAVLSDPSKRSKYDEDEEVRIFYRDSNRDGNSGHPSTSYSSSYERGSGYGRQAGFSTSSERSNSRRYWYDGTKSYGNYRW